MVEVKGKKVEKFKAGTIELAPDELGEYRDVARCGRPQNRSTWSRRSSRRLQSSWAVSGETTTGGPAAAPCRSARPTTWDVGHDGLDVVRLHRPSDDPAVVQGLVPDQPDPEAITEQLNGVVQFPVSSFPASGPAVRVLNGTTDTTMASRIAPDLARAGGEVLLVGNAKSLDVGSTTVALNDEFKGVADAIAEAVGVSAERTDEISDAAGIDVVLGADQQP